MNDNKITTTYYVLYDTRGYLAVCFCDTYTTKFINRCEARRYYNELKRHPVVNNEEIGNITFRTIVDEIN